MEPYRLVQHDALQYEDRIVWIKPVIGVKEKIITTRSRNRKPGIKNIVGYGILFDETPNNGQPGQFFRRVFLLDETGPPPDKVLPGVSLDKCKI